MASASRVMAICAASRGRRDGGDAHGAQGRGSAAMGSPAAHAQAVKVATVALANKTARVAWAVMARNEVYAAAAA